MSKAFDPYQAWLGIPPSRRPPSPYEILGVAEGETEYERIREATAERYDQVRTLVLGPQREHALRLLDDISQAFVSLTEDGPKDAAKTRPPPPLPVIDMPPRWPVTPPPLDGVSHRRKRRPRSVAVVLLAPIVWVDKRLESIAGRDNTILHGFLRCVTVVLLLLLLPAASQLVSSLKQRPAGIVAATAFAPEAEALESKHLERRGPEREDPEETDPPGASPENTNPEETTARSTGESNGSDVGLHFPDTEEPATDEPNGMRPEAVGTEPVARSSGVEPRLPLPDDQELVAAPAGSSGPRSEGRPDVGQADSILLRLHLAEGETYQVRITEEMTYGALPGLSTEEPPMTKVFDVSCHVKSVRADGVADVGIKYDLVQARQAAPTGSAEFDSSEAALAESLDTSMRTIAALAGASFRIDVTPTGQVTMLTGADQIVSRMLEDVENKEAVEERARREYGDEAMKTVTQELFGAFPDQPVAIGDSWSARSVAPRGFAAVAHDKWTLRSRRGGVALLELQSTVRPDPDAPAMGLGGAKLEYDLRGTRSGAVLIDEATGWVLRSTVRQSLSGELKIEDGTQSAEIAAFPVSIERITRVEHLEEMGAYPETSP